MPESHNSIREIHRMFKRADQQDIGDATKERIVSPDLFPPLAKTHGITICGLSEAYTGFCFVRTRHPWWQTLICISGQGEVWDPQIGDWSICGPGYAYVTPPMVPHAYRAISTEYPWHLAWVNLLSSHVAAQSDLPVLLKTDAEPLAASIRGLHTESLQGGVTGADPLVTESWCALVRAYAMRLCVAASMRHEVLPGDARLRRLFVEVAAELAHPWTLEKLAAKIHMSAEHLRRLCRAEGMESPLRRVTELRMRHAAALLAAGNYTVERAALAVGYENPFAFSTAFKRVMGRSPSAFRSKIY